MYLLDDGHLFVSNNVSSTLTGVVYSYQLSSNDEKNGWHYVGATTDETKRRYEWQESKSRYGGKKITDARNTYGVSVDSTWKYEVLEIVTAGNIDELQGKLTKYESEWIKKLDSVEKGFNSSYGQGNQGMHLSDEHKKKIGDANRGKKKPRKNAPNLNNAK